MRGTNPRFEEKNLVPGQNRKKREKRGTGVCKWKGKGRQRKEEKYSEETANGPK